MTEQELRSPEGGRTGTEALAGKVSATGATLITRSSGNIDRATFMFMRLVGT